MGNLKVEDARKVDLLHEDGLFGFNDIRHFWLPLPKLEDPLKMKVIDNQVYYLLILKKLYLRHP